MCVQMSLRPFQPLHQGGVSGWLTVGKCAHGSVLQLLQGCVLLEALCKMLCALWTNGTIPEAANKVKIRVSAGANSGETGRGGVLELHQCGIRVERLCYVCRSLRLQFIAAEAAKESRIEVLEGADSRESGVNRHTRRR